MIFRWVCVLALSAATHCVWAQESKDAWLVDPQLSATARALLPPEANQRRNLADPHSRLSPDLQAMLPQRVGSQERDAIAVRVILAAKSSAKTQEAMRRQIAQLGGEIETTIGDVIYANLAAAPLSKLARSRDIRLIEPQAHFGAQAHSTEVPSSTPDKSALALATLHDKGLRGKGVRVGILDFSFAGYDALVAAKQLPAPLAQREFGNDVGNDVGSAISTNIGHGTECARIIHEIAPDAALILASVGDGGQTTEGRVLAAALWLAAQGARIINFSGAGYVSPLDGAAPLDVLIDQLSAHGSTWVVAAGNQAHLHWQGPIADDNRNGWLDLGPVDMPHAYGDLFIVEVARTGSVNFTLNWSPWNAQKSDLDLFLYRSAADGKLVQIAQSDLSQASANARPLETIQTVLEPGYYLLGVRGTRLRDKSVAHLFVSGAKRMAPVIAAGSVGSPGTAKSAITVGASGTNDQTLTYSARGPTSDGRTKPELLASGGSSQTSFHGSSAAAPRVTGFAALVQGKQGTVREALQRRARPAPDKQALWGVLSAEELLRR